jgi:type I thyroxine 5'-deiodinase
VRDQVLFSSAKSPEDRTATAQACVRKLNIRVPALLDGLDNPTEAAYTGWPDRLYIVDTKGRVAFKSAPGPFGFSTKKLEQAIGNLLRGG